MINLIRMKLVNYIGIYLGLGLNEFEINRENSNNNIILLIGDNGSGKTTILTEMTPFPLEHVGSRIGSRILPNKIGIKELDFLVDEKYLYKIKIVYDKGTKCFIRKIYDDNDQELNPNGNVESYLECIKNELKISKKYINIGYLSKDIKNFVGMKPTERNNYISEWMPEISDFLDAYKITTKIINRLKKEIDNYNNEIGKMSSINCEIELNLLNNNIKEIQERIEKINKTMTELNIYQEQIKNNVIPYQELNNMSIDFFDKKEKLDTYNKYINERYSKLNTIEELEPKEFDKKLNLLKSEYEKNISILHTLEENIFILEEDISSNTDIIENSYAKDFDFTTVTNTIDYNKNIMKTIDDAYNEYIKTFGSLEDITCENENIIVSIKNLLDNLENDFKSINNVISIDILNEPNSIETLMEKEENKLKMLKELLDNISNECISIDKEIYRYENSNLDEKILMKRPNFCLDKHCDIIEELMNYFDPTRIINEKKEELKQKLDEKRDLTNKIEIQEKYINDIKYSIKFYTRIESTLMANKELIANLPPLLFKYFNSNPFDIYSKINEIKLNINDIIDFNSMRNKRNELEKSNNDLLNILEIIKTNDKIKDKISNNIQKYDEYKQKRDKLRVEIDDLKNTIETYESYNVMIIEREKDLYTYNINIEKLSQYKNSLEVFNKSTYVYNSNNKILDEYNSEKIQLELKLNELNKKRDEMTTFYISKRQIETMRNEIQNEMNKVIILNKVCSPKIGYPAWVIKSYLNELTIKTNSDLGEMWGSGLRIKEFKLDESTFSIVMNKGEEEIPDASICSRGETSTLNMTISLAMLEMNIDSNGYDVIRLDEVDDALDEKRRHSFIRVIKDRIDQIGCNTCAIISHNDEFEDAECDVILLKGSHLSDEKLMNKNILYKYE